MEDFSQELTKEASILSVDELCPEERPFFSSIFKSENKPMKNSHDLAFGIDGGGIAMTALIIEAAKYAIAELWDIIKPSLKETIEKEFKESNYKIVSSIFKGRSEELVRIYDEDYDRIILAAEKSAIRNGSTQEEAKKIAQSVGRSIRHSIKKSARSDG